MRKDFIFLSAIVILGSISLTNAAVAPIGPFIGEFSEGFETAPFGQFVSQIEVFDEEAIAKNLDGGPYLNVTGGWSSQDTGDRVIPHSGSRFMGSTYKGVEWIFDIPAVRFGGYFTTLNLGVNFEGAIANFFDVEDNTLGHMDVTAPYNSRWTWNGWMSDVPIKRVEIIGMGFPDWDNLGGFVMHDDMEYTPVPEPGTLLLIGLGGLVSLRKPRT
jgi:hypothetical protein